MGRSDAPAVLRGTRVRLWLVRRLLPRGYRIIELPPWKQVFGPITISGKTSQ